MAMATPSTLLKCLYLSAAALVFLPITVSATEDTERQNETVAEDCSVPTTQPKPMSAMRVFIDPDTGEIRQPTAEELDAAAERMSIYSLLNRSSTGLRIEHKPDGARFVHLEGRFMHALVLTRAEDGTLVARCIDDAHEHRSAPAKESAPLR